jgi:hypothetical protein
MGYWSNGSEGFDWDEVWCRCCIHGGSEEFCAVKALHEIWNYEQCDAENKPEGSTERAVGEVKKQALDTLIVQTERTLPGGMRVFGNECLMFVPTEAEKKRRTGQLTLTLETADAT